MSEFTEEIGYNGQNATALSAPSRSYNADGGRIAVPNCKPIPSLSESELTRFWSKVDKSGDCWLWTGAKGKGLHAYGKVMIRRVTFKSSRVAYALTVGPIPDGMHVLHRCDNPPCVNPAHLFLGTHADNMADMNAKGRRVVTRCAKGHEYAGGNLGFSANGQRRCLTCRKSRMDKWNRIVAERRAAIPRDRSAVCVLCGATFKWQRFATTKYCSVRCRQRSSRRAYQARQLALQQWRDVGLRVK